MSESDIDRIVSPDSIHVDDVFEIPTDQNVGFGNRGDGNMSCVIQTRLADHFFDDVCFRQVFRFLRQFDVFDVLIEQIIKN